MRSRSTSPEDRMPGCSARRPSPGAAGAGRGDPRVPASPQAVLAEQLHGACLRPLDSDLLAKGHAHAGSEMRKCVVEDAVLVKIDLVAVGRLQKSETSLV